MAQQMNAEELGAVVVYSNGLPPKHVRTKVKTYAEGGRAGDEQMMDVAFNITRDQLTHLEPSRFLGTCTFHAVDQKPACVSSPIDRLAGQKSDPMPCSSAHLPIIIFARQRRPSTPKSSRSSCSASKRGWPTTTWTRPRCPRSPPTSGFINPPTPRAARQRQRQRQQAVQARAQEEAGVRAAVGQQARAARVREHKAVRAAQGLAVLARAAAHGRRWCTSSSTGAWWCLMCCCSVMGRLISILPRMTNDTELLCPFFIPRTSSWCWRSRSLPSSRAAPSSSRALPLPKRYVCT